MSKISREKEKKIENIVVYTLVVILLLVLFGRLIEASKYNYGDRFNPTQKVVRADEDLTASANFVSQDRSWLFDSDQGINIMYDLNYEEYNKNGVFISKLFDSSNDAGLKDYIYSRYESDYDSRWNIAIWNIDSFGLSILGQLGIENCDYHDFSIRYWRNKKDQRDEFIVECKDPDKYALDNKEIVRFIWTDGVHQTYTKVPKWVIDKLVTVATSSNATIKED